MIVGAPAPAVVELARAVDWYVHTRGAANVHPWTLELRTELLDAVRRLGEPELATAVDAAALLTFTEASERLGVSKRTVGRYVARGWLHPVGRRLVATEVEQLAREGNHEHR